MRKRKPSSSAAKRRPQFGLIAKGALVLLAAACSIGYAGFVLKNLAYFKVRDIYTSETKGLGPLHSSVVSSGPGAIDLSYLVGKNIFSLDLQKESLYISELYPNYKKVRLVRILPNRLFIDFIRRNPVACVRLYRDFCVDESLFLFDLPQQVKGAALPVIAGLSAKIAGPRAGRRYAIRELSLAVEIAREVKANRGLDNFTLKRIDAGSLDTASFLLHREYIWQGAAVPDSPAAYVEVKIGQSAIRDKVRLLNGVLTQMKKDSAAIQYIDLRFKEPVIKFRDAK